MTTSRGPIRFAILFAHFLATNAHADPVAEGPQDAAPSGLRAGVARVDISPPAGVPHLNWGSQTHVVSEAVDPPGILTTALVLTDGDTTHAYVDIDRGGVWGLEPVLERAAQAAGIPAQNIRFGATHTHAGPGLSRDKGPVGADLTAPTKKYAAYQQKVEDGIVQALVNAKKALRPVHAQGATGVGTINMNRRRRAQGKQPASVGRNPNGFVDRDLVVMRLDDAAGIPYAILVNYQCHGIVLTHENRAHSPDFVGMVRKSIEDAFPGVTAMFVQGAAGNLGPIEWGTGDTSVAHRLGTTLGLQAAAIASQIETVVREPSFEGFTQSTALAAREPWRVSGPRDGSLDQIRTIVKVPRRRFGRKEIAAMEMRVLQARTELAGAERTGDPWATHQAMARLRRDTDLLKVRQSPYDPTPLDVEVQILRIGNMAIVAMPGEPFAEIGAAIKKASLFAVTMFAGYSSGQGGNYMPVRSEYRHGGYEVERTPYGHGAAEVVIREASKMLKQLHQRHRRSMATR